MAARVIPAPRGREERGKDAQQDPRVASIRRLKQASSTARDKLLGSGWFGDVEEFFNLSGDPGSSPSFRPRVRIPQLQMLMLSEAVDLTDSSPKIYINRRTQVATERDGAREKAFQEEWRQGFWNLEILMATIWALLSGTGVLQMGFDPAARNGEGEVFLSWRHPGTWFPDPNARDEESRQWEILEDRLTLDEIYQRWPYTAQLVPRRPVSSGRASDMGWAATGGSTPQLVMPSGPMSLTGGFGSGVNPVSDDNRYEVNQLFIYDSTRRRPTRQELKDMGGDYDQIDTTPVRLPAYPNGRWIVECHGAVLFDGDNWVPHRKFPTVRILGSPSLGSIWGVPPTSYTKDLQALAERMYAQLYENAARINNSVIKVYRDSGLSAEEVYGIPGEVLMINPNSKGIEFAAPGPLPAQAFELPEKLLALQRDLQGFTPARMGNPGSGNVSGDLFDSSVYQAQQLTRLRGVFLARSIQRVAELGFYLMGSYYKTNRAFPVFDEKDTKGAKWTPIDADELKEWQVWIDPGSVRAMSSTMLRKMVPTLRQMGLLDAKNALEMIDIPNAEEIAERLEQEQALAALASLKKGRR